MKIKKQTVMGLGMGIGAFLILVVVFLFRAEERSVWVETVPIQVPKEEPETTLEFVDVRAEVQAPRPATPDPLNEFITGFTRRFPFGRTRQAALRALLVNAPIEDVLALLDMTFGTESLNDMSHVLLEHLAMMDAEAALAFARQNGFGTEPPWWHSVLGGLDHPEMALADIHALPPSDTRNSYVGHIAIRWAQSDPAGALDYALYASPEETRQNAVANVVIGVSRVDPEAGFSLSVKYGEACEEVALVRSVAVDWAAGSDAERATATILSLPEGACRQEALYGLASVAITRDVSSAWSIIDQVNNSEKRNELIEAAAIQWIQADPVAAEDWLNQTSELDADRKASIRSYL